MNKNIAIIAVIIIFVGAGSFYGGMVYAKKGQSQTGQNGNSARFQRGVNGVGVVGNVRGNASTNGEILSKDIAGITVKLRDGGSKIIITSNATKIIKSVDGSFADLVKGQQVMIIGETGSDGSITAQSIQVRPAQVVPSGEMR